MRTVLGGQALLGFFSKMLTAPTAPPAHRWWWWLLGLIVPGNTFKFWGGAIGIPSPFLCLECAFWTCTTRHRFDAQASSGEVAGRFRGSQKMCRWMCGWKTRHSQDVHPKSSSVVLFEPQLDSLPLCFKKDQELFAFFWPFTCVLISARSLNYFVSILLIIGLNSNHFERINSYLTLVCSSAFQAWSTSGKCSSMHISQIPWLKFKLVRDDKYLSRCIQWPFVSFAFLQ